MKFKMGMSKREIGALLASLGVKSQERPA